MQNSARVITIHVMLHKKNPITVEITYIKIYINRIKIYITNTTP
jgi:hypothetical protein